MSVFISWSGRNSLSFQFAELLKAWLPKVIQRLPCYLSASDIDAGSIWLAELLQALDRCNVGILCLTSENIGKPWVHFEAGALSGRVERVRVCPITIDFTPSELSHPLSVFQGKTTSEADLFDVLKMINSSLGDQVLDGADLQDSFARAWPLFQRAFDEMRKEAPKPEILPTRDPSETLAEILTIVRSLADTRSLRPSPTLADVKIPKADSEVPEVWGRFISEVINRRPLIRGWVEVAVPSYDNDTLTLWFRRDANLAFESCERPNNSKFLNELARELGISQLELRRLPS